MELQKLSRKEQTKLREGIIRDINKALAEHSMTRACLHERFSRGIKMERFRHYVNASNGVPALGLRADVRKFLQTWPQVVADPWREVDWLLAVGAHRICERKDARWKGLTTMLRMEQWCIRMYAGIREHTPSALLMHVRMAQHQCRKDLRPITFPGEGFDDLFAKPQTKLAPPASIEGWYALLHKSDKPPVFKGFYETVSEFFFNNVPTPAPGNHWYR